MYYLGLAPFYVWCECRECVGWQRDRALMLQSCLKYPQRWGESGGTNGEGEDCWTDAVNSSLFQKNKPRLARREAWQKLHVQVSALPEWPLVNWLSVTLASVCVCVTAGHWRGNNTWANCFQPAYCRRQSLFLRNVAHDYGPPSSVCSAEPAAAPLALPYMCTPFLDETLMRNI